VEMFGYYSGINLKRKAKKPSVRATILPLHSNLYMYLTCDCKNV